MACYDKKFQTCALNSKRDLHAVALADFLFEKNLLLRDGAVVVLNQDGLASYDVSYVKQNELGFGPRANELFVAFQSSAHWTAFGGKEA